MPDHDPSQDHTLRPAPRGAPGVPRRVLVCLDRSAWSESAIPYARALARHFQSRIDLVHVLECRVPEGVLGPQGALDWQIARAEAEVYLKEIAERFEPRQDAVRTRVLQGHAAEQVLCMTEEEEIDLIIATSHGEKGLTEWRLGSTVEKIVQRAPTSILVVPAKSSTGDDATEARLNRVLALLDGSTRAEAVLPLLARLGRESALDIELLHVVEPAPLMRTGDERPEDIELAERLDRRNRTAAERYLRQVEKRFAGAGRRVSARVEDGDPRRVVPQLAARAGTDLVAMTAHGWTGDRGSAEGGLAAHLLRYAGVPVLILQNHPLDRADFAASVRHRRREEPLRGHHAPGQP